MIIILEIIVRIKFKKIIIIKIIVIIFIMKLKGKTKLLKFSLFFRVWKIKIGIRINMFIIFNEFDFILGKTEITRENKIINPPTIKRNKLIPTHLFLENIEIWHLIKIVEIMIIIIILLDSSLKLLEEIIKIKIIIEIIKKLFIANKNFWFTKSTYKLN